MTNPNNALGTNAALGGRTSVDAFNDAISSLTRGVVSGFAVTPSSAMTLNVGGTAGVRDVAVAVSPNGNRVSVDNRTTSPIKVTMAAASASSARIDAIVAYVNSPSQVTETTPDNPTACGIIPVSGTASAQPTDSAIRTAISADGGTGSTAYYAIIAIVRLAANTTTITSNMITMQKSRIADNLVTNASIADKTIKSDKVDWTTFPSASIVADGSNTSTGVGTVYYKRLLPNVYLLWGQITPTGSSNTVALPHPSFSTTHSQVFTLYGAGMNSTKGFISNTDRTHIGFTRQTTGNTYALWGIAFLDESA